MKKMLSAVLVLLMLTGLMLPAVSAANEGTPIDSVADFENMSNGKYYLADNIDFSGKNYTNWVVENFSGTLDGNGYALSNINITTGDEIDDFGGVFGHLAHSGDTTVRNIKIENLKLTLQPNNDYGQNTAGFLAGNQASASYKLVLEKVSVSGEASGKVRALGGLLGTARNLEARECSTYGSVYIEDSVNGKNPRHIGGLFGETQDGAVKIYDSANHIDITIPTSGGQDKYLATAGMIGVSGNAGAASETVEIYNSVNFGRIHNGNIGYTEYSNNIGSKTSHRHTAGGMIALMIGRGASVISGCVSFGDISGGYHAGGIVGWNANTPLTVRNCIVWGNVFGNKSDENKSVISYDSQASAVTNCIDKRAEELASSTSEDIAIMGVQESAVSGSKFNVRVAATLKNTKSYNSIGFEVVSYSKLASGGYAEKRTAHECQNVFKKLTANNGMNEEYTADKYGAENFFALTFKNVPAAADGSFFMVVRPYAVSGDERVYGDWKSVLWSEGTFVGVDGKPSRNYDIRVMSYNILSDELSNWEKPYDNRLPLWCAQINELGVDIAGMQEIDQAAYAAIETQLGGRYAFTSKVNEGGEHSFTSILYNKNTLTLIESGVENYEIQRTPSGGNTVNQQIRIINWGVFEKKGSGERFIFISTHWNANNYGGEGMNVRAVQAAQLTEKVNALVAKYNLPLMSTGDFNCSANQNYFKNYLKDTNQNVACDRASLIEITPTSDKMIDQITYTSEGLEAVYYRRPQDNTTIQASDHDPVYADIRFK